MVFGVPRLDRELSYLLFCPWGDPVINQKVSSRLPSPGDCECGTTKWLNIRPRPFSRFRSWEISSRAFAELNFFLRLRRFFIAGDTRRCRAKFVSLQPMHSSIKTKNRGKNTKTFLPSFTWISSFISPRTRLRLIKIHGTSHTSESS